MTTINDIPGDTAEEQRDWLFDRWCGVSNLLFKVEAQRDDLRKAATTLAKHIPEVDEARGIVELRVNGVARDYQPELYAALVTLCRVAIPAKKTVTAE